jgi:hypothetical protein
MLPTLTLPTIETRPIIRGDTWHGIALKMSQDAVDVDLTDCTIRITFISRKESFTLSTGGNGITITSPTEGEFAFDEITALVYRPGVYTGDLEITYPTGRIKTYCQVELTISDDITK